MSDDRNAFLGTVMSFLTGAAIGAGLALLFAPQSGEETRKQIKDVTDKVSDEVKGNYEKVASEAQKAIEQVKTASDKAIGQIKTFIEGAKDNIKKEVQAEIKEAAKPTAKKKA